MRRAILTAALVPVAAGAAGYGFARTLARYFDNPLEVLERMADETLDYFENVYAGEVLGIYLDDE